jgi:hypothetical protein
MKYCPKCGKKNDFAANFCCICANPFVSLSSVETQSRTESPPKQEKSRPTNPILKKRPAQTYKPVFTESDNPEEDDDNDSGGIDLNLIAGIQKLDVEIQNVESRPSTIGALMQGGSEKGAAQALKDSKRKQGKISKADMKATVEKLMSEGKAIRPK